MPACPIPLPGFSQHSGRECERFRDSLSQRTDEQNWREVERWLDYCLSHFLSEIKKVQEKNQFALDSIDGIFCSELNTVLKQTIAVWNRHREGTARSGYLAQRKDWLIPKI